MFTGIFSQRKSNVIFSSSSFDILKYSISDLIDDYTIKNWSKNRPSDEVRVSQIKQYYNDNKVHMVDGIISAWLVGNDLLLYDGIHRLNAAVDADHDMTCIVKIVKETDENYIINDFKRINSSVSIPFLYLEDTNEVKRKVCESVMKLMCNKFPNCVSASRNPWKCNFNRDNFIENILSKVNVDFHKNNIDKFLFQTLLGINTKAKQYVFKNNIEHFKKCETYDFFIMYFSNELIISEIESSILML